ncbi:MAG: hypothetical protein GY854_29505 [Deltaproteobacteria bacterium]|nr:hypothetical protein [Deltaproteobacteria bacterium]
MSTFGSLLVQDRVVDVTQIERALQHQVIYGGNLETNLLELGLVDEQVVAKYAARALGLPVLDPNLVEAAESSAIKLVPWETINTHRVLPIRIDSDKMTIAVSNQLPEGVFEKVSFLLGVEFIPHYVLDFRLAAGLNRYYGIPVATRLRVLQQRNMPDFKPDQTPVVTPPQGDKGLFPGVDPRFQPEEKDDKAGTSPSKKKDESAEESFALIESETEDDQKPDTTIRIFTPSSGKKEPAKPASSNNVPSPIKVVASAPPSRPEKPLRVGFNVTAGKQTEPPFDIDKAQERLQSAEARDIIIDLLMEYSRKVFDFTVLLVVHGDMAQGRAAALGSRKTERVDHLAIPLNKGGMFQTVFETRAFHLGPLGTSEVEEEALRQMNRRWPHNCAILPVTLRHRVIMMVYGDSGDKTVQADYVSLFSRLIRHVGDAFEQILLKQKAGEAKPKVRSFVPLKSLDEVPSSPPPSPSPPRDSHRKGLADWAGRYHVKESANTGSQLVDSVTGPDGRKPSWPPPSREPEEKDRNVERSDVSPGAYSSTMSSRKMDSIPPEDDGETRLVNDPSSVDAADEYLRRETRDYLQVPPTAIFETTKKDIKKPKPTDQEKRYPVLSRSVVTISDKGTSSKAPPSPREVPRNAALAPETSGIDKKSGVKTSAVVSVKGPDKPRSVMVEMKEEIDRLVERILAPGRFDEPAAKLLVGIGDDALGKLIRHFPGPLTCDRYQKTDKLPRVGQHGSLLRTLLMFKEKAVSFVLPLFESRDSDVRFYATFMFSELKYPSVLGALTARLFDNDRQIRALAIDVIKEFEKYPEYRWAMREVLSVLTSANSGLDAKRIAAEALGELREHSAVGIVAEMLASVDTVLVERCHRALIKITYTDFGFSAERWGAWWRKNRQRHPIEWAIDAVAHPKELIRNAAYKKLRSTARDALDWPLGPLNHKQRLDLQKKLRMWWSREGKALFPNHGGD